MHNEHDFCAYDQATTIAAIKGWVDKFAAERNWERFHLPKNLAMSVAIEAGELMEHFQWESLEAAELSSEKKEAVSDEIADVLSYLLRLSSVLDIDLSRALQRKIVKNSIKYPVSHS